MREPHFTEANQALVSYVSFKGLRVSQSQKAAQPYSSSRSVSGTLQGVASQISLRKRKQVADDVNTQEVVLDRQLHEIRWTMEISGAKPTKAQGFHTTIAMTSHSIDVLGVFQDGAVGAEVAAPCRAHD